MYIKSIYFFSLLQFFSFCCTKKEMVLDDTVFKYQEISLNGKFNENKFSNVHPLPKIKFKFSKSIDTTSIKSSILLRSESGQELKFTYTTSDSDSTLWITALDSLDYFSLNDLYINSNLKSVSNKSLESSVHLRLVTSFNPTPQPVTLSDDSLLTLVQQRTFKYFWDFGHPVSGLSRERNTSGDVCTSGGSGFGIMSILVGIQRNFISREDGLNRLIQITDFLTDKVITYHGAYPHWFNGTSGATIPFSQFDDGVDLVETSYLMMGLLCARKFFTKNNNSEKKLRNQVDYLFNRVEGFFSKK
ncbi:MAG: hypothetical protein IPI30_06370 [Saprospiraceae bacterium]|nr:hypothetical protein [Candidatus Vicinibacter affinis]